MSHFIGKFLAFFQEIQPLLFTLRKKVEIVHVHTEASRAQPSLVPDVRYMVGRISASPEAIGLVIGSNLGVVLTSEPLSRRFQSTVRSIGSSWGSIPVTINIRELAHLHPDS